MHGGARCRPGGLPRASRAATRGPRWASAARPAGPLMGATELTERLDEPADNLRHYVLFAADRVFRAALEALAHIEEWERWPPFSHGYHIELSETFGATVGVRFDAANMISAWAVLVDASGRHQVALGSFALSIPVQPHWLSVLQEEGVPYCSTTTSCA